MGTIEIGIGNGIAILTGLLSAGVIVYKLGRFEGTMNATVTGLRDGINSLRDWMKEITKSGCPMGVKHSEVLAEHTKRLDHHDERIGDLEKHDAGHCTKH